RPCGRKLRPARARSPPESRSKPGLGLGNGVRRAVRLKERQQAVEQLRVDICPRLDARIDRLDLASQVLDVLAVDVNDLYTRALELLARAAIVVARGRVEPGHGLRDHLLEHGLLRRLEPVEGAAVEREQP